MKRFWMIAGVAALVAVLGVAALGAVALAQDGDNALDWPFNFRERMREAIASVLGIPVEEYDAAVETAQERVLEDAVAEGWLTEEQAERMQERFGEGFGPGAMGHRGGKFGRMPGGFLGGPDRAPLSVAADALGMTVEDLRAELQDGKSIAQLADEKNVDTQTIVDAYLAQIAETLDTAVENGRLTRERADWMLEQAGERIPDLLDNTWEDCGPGGFRGGGRPGRFEGFPGQDDA